MPGNLVVVLVGDGSGALAANSTPAYLREYSSGSNLVQTINLPVETNGSNYPLTISGSATSEGFLRLSVNGQYLTMAGYGVSPGFSGPATATGIDVPRVVGRIDASGNINTTTVMTNYSGSNIRGAVSTDGTQIWTSGNGGSGQGATAGVRYMTLGSPDSVRLNDTASNMRVVNIFNGQLYVSSATGTNLGVNTVGTGLPTTGEQANPLYLLPGFPTSGTHSPYDYWFKDANTLYVADDGSTASGGGIQKWVFSENEWLLQYILFTNSLSAPGVRGLTGTTNGNGDAVLYATSSVRLLSVTDTGPTSVVTTNATAPSNTAFRGIAWAPSAGVVKPNITSIVQQNNNVVMTWQSQSGKTYVVESRVVVNTGAWGTNYTVTASGATTSYTNAISGSRYFRVGLTP